MKPTIPVIDLFAGPGGLGEGFSAFVPGRGSARFETALSIEMDAYAHQTLTLRSFFRKYTIASRPESYYGYLRGEISLEKLKARCPEAWESAERESLCAELGNPDHQQVIDDSLSRVLGESVERPIVLIGGPPCQAYSLAGRSRNRGVDGYIPEEDARHTLYLEYLKVIAQTWPAVFVMENVKGILSSTLSGERMFSRIRQDLQNPKLIVDRLGMKLAARSHTYRLWPVCAPDNSLFGPDETEFKAADFVVCSENLGLPQRRHRVIIIGIRDDIDVTPDMITTDAAAKPPTVGDVIGGLPKLRSGLSRGDDVDLWRKAVASIKRNGSMSQIEAKAGKKVAAIVGKWAASASIKDLTRGSEFVSGRVRRVKDPVLREWLEDSRLKGVCNHATRGHIEADLHRYVFATAFARVHGRSPSLRDFPESLYPKHRSAARAIKSGSLFADRFRVQVEDDTSTTIMSHISKDGHYYIHPDPAQCRSLTVREAARLQTFPDNYFFCGPRTSQYVQVGNAVPPLLAKNIAGIVHRVLREAQII